MPNPANQDAERAVIGLVLLDPRQFDRVAEINADSFTAPALREIWSAIVDLHRRGDTADLVAVNGELRTRGSIARIEGGEQAVFDLAGGVPVGIEIERHVQVVREAETLRRLQLLGADVVRRAGSGESSAELLEAIGRELSALAGSVPTRLEHVSDVAARVFEALEQRQQSGGLVGLSWGIRRLDELTGGLRPGNLIVIGARPCLGKTALGDSVVANAALRGAAALIFNLEMVNDETVERLLAYYARIDSDTLRRGTFTDWSGLTGARSKLISSGLYLHDRAVRFGQVCAEARRWRARNSEKPGVVLVDYMQLAEAEQRGQTRERVVAEMSRALKQLAKELSVPVIAVSQLNRQVEADGREPRLSDLRESGSVEQDADVVILILRDKPSTPQGWSAGPATLILAKNRNGRSGKVHVHWTGKHYAFDEETTLWEQEET
jgi:replicative DNA helicase